MSTAKISPSSPWRGMGITTPFGVKMVWLAPSRPKTHATSCFLAAAAIFLMTSRLFAAYV